MKTRAALRFSVLAAIALAATPIADTSARENDVVIASGARGRTYHDVYAVNLATLLPAYRLRHRVTEGSGENLDLLASGAADVGFVQLDVYAARMRADPARYAGIGFIGPLVEECIFIAYRKGGAVNSASALKAPVGDRSPRLVVGERGSGMNGTWAYVVEREPSYGNVEVKHTGGTLAINHLAAGMVDAVAWVTDPGNREHKLYRAVRSNDALGLFGLADPALVHALTSGAEVYSLRRLPTGLREPETFDTICTRTVILTKPDAAPRLVDAVSDALSLHRARLIELHHP